MWDENDRSLRNLPPEAFGTAPETTGGLLLELALSPREVAKGAMVLVAAAAYAAASWVLDRAE